LYALALKFDSGSIEVGNFQKSTSSAPATQNLSSVVISPDSMFFVGDKVTTPDTDVANAHLYVGSGDDAAQVSTAWGARNGTNPSEVKSISGGTKAITVNDGTNMGVADAKASLSLASAIPVLTWDPNSSNAVNMGYMAFQFGVESGGGGGSGNAVLTPGFIPL